MASAIPKFYRIFFNTVDPVIAFAGFINYLQAPKWFLQSFTPNPVVPPTAETRNFLDTLAGYYAGTIFLQVYLLRARPNDLTVWRSLQVCILIVDFAILGAYARAFEAEGRLHWERWRPQEWGQIGVLTVLAFIRLAFLGGLGFGKSSVRKQK